MQADSIKINLDYLPPTPERLSLLPEKTGEAGCKNLCLRIIDNFPWDFECRMKASTAYDDSILSWLSKKCRETGIRLVFVFPGRDDYIRLLRLSGWRYLKENERSALKISTSAVGFKRFVETIVSDFTALCPGVDDFMICDKSDNDDGNIYKDKIHEILHECGATLSGYHNIDDFTSAEEFISGHSSEALLAFKECRKARDVFSVTAAELKHMQIMSNLSFNPPAACRINLNSSIRELQIARNSLEDKARVFAAAAEGVFEYEWTRLFIKSILFAVEEEYSILLSRLKQSNLLNQY